ncbi:MAG: electron transport complex subunit RsxC [Porticoccaceae bacterium]|nr:electron transport complex subunit RsxC [Porticoccaceae bacterium]
MSRTWETPGGVHPPENKLQSMTQSIGHLPIPGTLVIPLHQHIGSPETVDVTIGQTVLKGQKLTTAIHSDNLPVHASTSGTVIAIDDHPVAHPSGLNALCVTIASDGKDQWIERTGIADFRRCGPLDLLQIITDAGIAGMGGAGFPAAIKLSPSNDKTVDTLIINATECEPYITADDAAMRGKTQDLIQGIEVVCHILNGPKRVVIGIEDNKPQAIKALRSYVQESSIKIVPFPTKYPSGGEKQLIYILTGREVPSGGLPIDLGMVCLNIGTLIAIKRAIVDGEPLISRITTVTGEACGVNRNYEVLIGTPISHLLTHNEFDENNCSRLIMGGPMMGFSLTSTDVPVVKTTNCILAPSHSEIPVDTPAQACIRCGLCAEACPVSLLPQQLFWYAQAKDQERLEAHNLFDCIECGACSYVCPSNIPLVQHYRSSKGEIRKANIDKIDADNARQRFEFRKLRLEQADKQRQAKREARRLVTEQARAASSTSQPGSSAADIIAAAQQRAITKKASPDQQKAKLERALLAAQSRLQEAEKRLIEATINGSTKQQTICSASVESARQKVDQVQHRLRELTD